VTYITFPDPNPVAISWPRTAAIKPQICDGRHSGAGRSMSYWPHLHVGKLMSKHQTNTIDTSATSKQVHESTDRELTANELAHVSGGRKSAGQAATGVMFLAFPFKLVAV
jgi:bacteriocin-like protein